MIENCPHLDEARKIAHLQAADRLNEMVKRGRHLDLDEPVMERSIMEKCQNCGNATVCVSIDMGRRAKGPQQVTNLYYGTCDRDGNRGSGDGDGPVDADGGDGGLALSIEEVLRGLVNIRDDSRVG